MQMFQIFTWQLFNTCVEALICARHFAECWEYGDEHDRAPAFEEPSLAGRLTSAYPHLEQDIYWGSAMY